MNERYININEVRNKPNKPWDKCILSHNKRLTVKDIEVLQLPKSRGDWNWYWISRNINIQEVRNNPKQPWDKRGLSGNKHITVKDIRTLQLPNNNSKWLWSTISMHIDIQELINNPNQPWDRYGLIHNSGITDKIIEFFDAGLLKHLQKNIGAFKYHTDIAIKCE